jgi:ribosomal protein S18 acetylase RimI-like enzyme
MGITTKQGNQAIVREIEERGLNAWPALRRIFLDGWILGLSEGYTRRANSVNPIYDGIRDVPDKIPICEETFSDHNLPCVFKVTPIGEEMGLDVLLEARGYEKQATTHVQVLTLDAASDSTDDEIEVLDDVDDAWMKEYAHLKRMSDPEAAKNRTILDRIGLRKRFVSLIQNQKRVASGIAVVESGWVGLFGIVTDPERRRQGLGKRLTKALGQAGVEAGARTAYLQVEADNPAALKLYESLGLEDVYSYWYRGKR